MSLSRVQEPSGEPESSTQQLKEALSKESDVCSKECVRAVEKCERRSDLALTLARVYHSAYNVFHMRRLNELLGRSSGLPPCGSPVWILGLCHEGSDDGTTLKQEVADSILADFASRLWFTYRKDFEAIGDSKLTADVGWGCMIRSGQMMLGQALLQHYLQRDWRWSSESPASPDYLQLVRSFGDCQVPSCPFSLHNIVLAGAAHGVTPGAWLGPYTLCRSLEALAESESSKDAFPFAVCVVSGEADGERGGAPVLGLEDVADLCRRRAGADAESSYSDLLSEAPEHWSPLLILVPLVLGVDKVNPRYLPSLKAALTFPQSVGIVGGKPGASVYIIGYQEEQVFYLDPHEVQPAVLLQGQEEKPDTSSYHCSTIRRMPIDSLDNSLALGFYCRDHGEFVDLCHRVTTLTEAAGGAPMFTVDLRGKSGASTSAQVETQDFEEEGEDESSNKDEWQLL
ncbi:Cysteine protease required for autophagy [Klebsormidium nitens]|uniref:Cysteine protease n=1 Tax=Klebsormidium nitens TaxID=105231 RepID=A0A1Y1I181_KLENI|nr:Cysteine protease required for autophagy [Klebsormidium nitens]|eukprot:GAQ83199.1 Cysteine protease required for autophagy [Klebsormidium nitens]